MNRYSIAWASWKKSISINSWKPKKEEYEKYLSHIHISPLNHWILVGDKFVTLQTSSTPSHLGNSVTINFLNVLLSTKLLD